MSFVVNTILWRIQKGQRYRIGRVNVNVEPFPSLYIFTFVVFVSFVVSSILLCPRNSQNYWIGSVKVNVDPFPIAIYLFLRALRVLRGEYLT